MIEGTIIKALSGFYYVLTENGTLICRARGKFRKEGMIPLVGDHVLCSVDSECYGRVDEISVRKNSFIRPAVANIDALIFVAAEATPVTEPWLIDRVSVIASAANAELILCVNKTDLKDGKLLSETYRKAGFTVISTSAISGEGVELLRNAIDGKTCAFTGNSGVGKSSLLNCLCPQFSIETGEISSHLGRGKHTTRHVEFFNINSRTIVADTPGFASFDIEMIEPIQAEKLQFHFRDFSDYLGKCRFNDCTHRKEPGCAVTEAVKKGIIVQSRYQSYCRLYELSASHCSWK